jgi:3-oxoacyl-[acyl-carrier protein] reductase
MQLLKDKVAIITGGSRGIGKSMVEDFVAQGAHVAFTYRSSAEEANAIAASLNTEETKVIAYQSDASSYTAAEEFVKQVMEDFGKIDILINNAGITSDNLLLRMGEEEWDKVINVNLKSVFNLSKHAMRPMLRARSGSIIHISSVVGVFGNAGQANYAASKAGVIGFSKSLAKEIGSRGIRSNVIAPGFIETDMTHVLDEKTKESFMSNIPLKNLGKGVDVSNAAIFLGSDMSTYITGQVLSVCGGMNM